MKLFLLLDPVAHHTEISGVLVRSKNEEAARQLANTSNCYDERWLNKNRTTCKEITLNGPTEVILAG